MRSILNWVLDNKKAKKPSEPVTVPICDPDEFIPEPKITTPQMAVNDSDMSSDEILTDETSTDILSDEILTDDIESGVSVENTHPTVTIKEENEETSEFSSDESFIDYPENIEYHENVNKRMRVETDVITNEKWTEWTGVNDWVGTADFPETIDWSSLNINFDGSYSEYDKIFDEIRNSNTHNNSYRFDPSDDIKDFDFKTDIHNPFDLETGFTPIVPTSDNNTETELLEIEKNLDPALTDAYKFECEFEFAPEPNICMAPNSPNDTESDTSSVTSEDEYFSIQTDVVKCTGCGKHRFVNDHTFNHVAMLCYNCCPIMTGEICCNPNHGHGIPEPYYYLENPTSKYWDSFESDSIDSDSFDDKITVKKLDISVSKAENTKSIITIELDNTQDINISITTSDKRVDKKDFRSIDLSEQLSGGDPIKIYI